MTTAVSDMPIATCSADRPTRRPPESAAERSDPLRLYLAERDVACPGCGYNLRGAATAQCPECGRRLELGLHVSGPLWRRRSLLVLLFLWLLLAGVMNGVRTGREIQASASQRQFVQVVGPQGGVRWWATGSGSNAPGRPAQRALRQFATMYDASGSPVMLPPPQIGRRGVILGSSNVRWSQWARLGGWGSLALLAAAGLVLLIVYRRKPASSRAALATLTLAWVSFGAYFSYHGYLFVTELL